MRKWMAGMVAMLLACTGVEAMAQEAYEMRGTIAPGMPEMTFTVTDTGERPEDGAMRENLLALQITASDSGFSQTLTYAASISTDSPAVAELVDFNFDGYRDLALCVGLGNNAYSIMALWNAEEGRFDAPYQELELGNYVLYPEHHAIFTYEKDGALYYRMTLYGWEGTSASSLVLDAQGGTYDTGDGGKTVGEQLVLEGTSVWRCWDMQYPADWYTNERVFTERYNVLSGCITGGRIDGSEARFARVANVDWVNLRREDRKSSPSLARLDAGTTVWILAEGCGEDGGWVRVLTEMETEAEGGRFVSQTGYIWHSFLKREEP